MLSENETSFQSSNTIFARLRYDNTSESTDLKERFGRTSMSHTRALRLDPGLIDHVGQPDSLETLHSDRIFF